MHLIHIYKDYAPVMGGIENYVRDLAEAQARAGHQVAVLVAQLNGKPEQIETINGVRVIKARRQLNVQSAPIAFGFPAHVARETAGADIAHLHAPYPIGELCNLAFGRAKKSVITWHSDIVRQKTLLRLYGPFLRRVLQRIDWIIPTSEQYARSSPWVQPHLAKCTPVPLGIDPARFAPSAQSRAHATELRRTWLAQAGLGDDALVLIGVGRLRYYKGHGTTIRALTQLPNTLAVLAGNGPMEVEWQALARELGVAQRAIFPGSPSDAELPAYLQAADVFAFPSNSRAEAFGIALLEGMASGLPAISTEVGSATSWINADGVSGRVIAPEDPAAFAAAVETLRDPALRMALGAAARARVAGQFTTERMVAGVEKVYQTLLSR
jgi:glycosyltransferase involved in cell wall biosynthesis